MFPGLQPPASSFPPLLLTPQATFTIQARSQSTPQASAKMFSATDSIRSSSFTTANISALDFSVFTTDSLSSWPPKSQSSLPVTSAPLSQSPDESQQDFVLFDSPRPCQAVLNSSSSLSSQHHHSNHNRKDTKLDNTSFESQRAAPISRTLGLHPSFSVNANSFPYQFYASSVPSSSVSLNRHQRIHSARPPVPLFNQSAGSTVHQHQLAKMMNAADVDLDDFTAFEGGASLFPSPAVSSVMDFGGGKSSLTSTFGTVSPHDLLNHDFMSTPNSAAAFTPLTTPSSHYNESPDLDSFDVSPNFGSTDFDGSGDPWYPLFPEDSVNKEAQLIESERASAETGEDEKSSMEQASAVDSRTTTIHSPSSAGRHSSVAGVSSRRRSKPLPPITVSGNEDPTVMKRHRNTLAARKSRERKVQYMMKLESHNAESEAENAQLKSRVAEIEAEQAQLKKRFAEVEAECAYWKRIAQSQSGEQ
ncbi:hypothetical protein E4U55_004763 [Claviceps digitariae]|nr:hypothetical protein E4U55_004763 [Claviceps digitariae]